MNRNIPVIAEVGYAFPIMLENDALVFKGAPQGSSSRPPSSCSLISASPSSCFRWEPNCSGDETVESLKCKN